MAKTNDGAPSDDSAPTNASASTNDSAPEPRVTPTEQIVPTPQPVSAKAAASGGASGLEDSKAVPSAGRGPKTSVVRRHPIATGVTAGIVAVVLAAGLTAWGVDTAVTASLTNQAAPIIPSSTATPGAASGVQGGPLDGRAAFRATIQNIANQGSDSATWTILTKRGQTFTVLITDATKFGTKKAVETQGSFAVGDSVVIVATRTAGTATAVRVVNAADIGAGASAPTPSTTSTATT